MERILSVKNLTVSFGEQAAVKGLDVEVGKRENLVVIGPNGSGKTVFLRALLGLVPYSGEIVWAEGASIGYVPQKIEADKHLPINFYNLLRAKGRIIGAGAEEIKSITEEVGLDGGLLNVPVGHLSGGQFQKALIAFAILGNPNVLLLDEPTSSIDTPGEEQINDLIHRLQGARGITVITVSHDVNFVYRYATKVLCLNKLKICFGEPEEALSGEILEKLYGPHKYYHHFHRKE